MEQEFLDEYDEIHDSLQLLYNYKIKDKDLRKEVFELIAILEEDYEQKRNEIEEILMAEWEKEDASEKASFDKERL